MPDESCCRRANVVIRIGAACWVILSLNSVATSGTLAGEEIYQRRTRIADMSATEKETLWAKRSRFDKLSPSEKQRLRDLHNDLAVNPKLQRTMSAYFEWLKSLPASLVAELKRLPIDGRIERIRQLRRQQQEHDLQQLASKELALKDVRAILGWASEFVEHHKDAILDQLGTDMRHRYEHARGHPRKRILIFAVSKLNAGPSPTDAELSRLQRRLSVAANQVLDSIADPVQKKRVLRRWIDSALSLRLNATDVDRKLTRPSTEVLERFYHNQLTPTERQRLDNLRSRIQFEAQLERFYYERKRANRATSGPFPARQQNKVRQRRRPETSTKRKKRH